MCEVPTKIQKCVRAVLLSKRGGVLVSAFSKDYKTLIQEALPHKKLGFDNIEDFLKAMPEVIRLEYSKKDMAYRAYGVCDHDTYQPTWIEKSTKAPEESPRHQRPNNKRPTQISNIRGDSININGENEIQPDDNGRYSIIYPRSKTPTYNEQNVRDKFQETGKISAVHMIDSWIFVRYMTAGEAVTARDMFKDELDTRFANSNKGKPKKNSNYQLSLNATSNHSGDVSSQTFSNSFGGSFSGGISGGSFGANHGTTSSVGSNTNSERGQRTNKDSVCYACGQSGHQKKDCLKYKGHGQFQVYIGNLAKAVTESNLDEIIENRLVTRVNINRTNDGNKVIGFLTFTNAKDAEDVINQWNGKMYHGRVLLVRNGKHSKDREQNNAISTDANLNISQVNQNHSNWKQKSDGINENFGSLHMKSTEDLNENVPQLSPRQIHYTDGSDITITRSALPTQVLRQNPELMKENIAIGGAAKLPVNRSNKQGFTPTILEHRLPAFEPIMSPLEPIMPHLEPIMPSLEPMVPELEPMMPDLEPDVMLASSEIEDQPIQVFVANFPAGTTEKELYALFIRYGVSQVRMVNNSQHFDRGCTKAFITLQSINDAVEAILDLDQTPYIDRMIKVAAPHGNDVLHQIVESRIQEYMSDSDSLPVSASTNSVSFNRSRRSTGTTNVGRPRSNDISYCEDVTDMSAQDASALLETFGHIRSKIQCKPPRPIKPGQKINISVSAWLIEHYYFAQNWSEMESLREMMEISQRIQSAENHLGRTKGLGRCAALYKEEWFRAWILRVDESKHAVKVIYIDYGNVCVIPSKDTRVVPSWVWDLPAQAKPVRIATEIGPFEKDMVDQVLPVTVKTILTVDKCPVIEVTIDDTSE